MNTSQLNQIASGLSGKLIPGRSTYFRSKVVKCYSRRKQVSDGKITITGQINP